jgi:hypothetical protein
MTIVVRSKGLNQKRTRQITDPPKNKPSKEIEMERHFTSAE